MAELKKEIGLISGIAQLSTTLLGTGLFMVPAIAAGVGQTFSLWAWLVLFVAICPIAITFAILGKRYPNAGGTAYFVKQAFNSRLESSVAWLFLSVLPVGVPAAINLTAGFLQQLLPPLSDSLIWAQVVTIAILLGVNAMGAKSSGRLQTLIALAIIVLVVAMLWKAGFEPLSIPLPQLSSDAIVPIGASLAIMFWCFVGIEAFAHMGEEFKNPSRDFPIAIVVGCLLAGLTYYACSTIVLHFSAYGSPYFDNQSIPWLTTQLFGEGLSWGISLVGFAACFASLNLYTQSLSRMIWSQARTHKPQSAVANVTRRGVPLNATLIVCIVVWVSCLAGVLFTIDVEHYLALANGVFVVIYLLAMVAAYKLLSGWAKLLAVLSIVLCLGVLLSIGWAALYAIIIFALLSMPWKRWFGRKEFQVTSS